jgi:SAM-dependent methyltransferase
VIAEGAALANQIVASLRRREALPDHELDRIFPAEHRHRSWLHWTPTEVALRACAWLAPGRRRSVLDVGAGVGKVCLIGALTTASRWFGVEEDAAMVSAALEASRQLGIARRTHFKHGGLGDVKWTSFDAFYFFNPFAETLLDSACEPIVRQARHLEQVHCVHEGIASTRPGTRVVTYHGFGGDLADLCELVRREPAGGDELCLWIRRKPRVSVFS